jgi:hypothetical protein
MTNSQGRTMDGLTPVQRMAVKFRGQPLPGRGATAGAVCLGALGGLVGLIVGLIGHAPTAPFAVVELGLPAALVGGVIGFVGGLILVAGRRIRRRPRHRGT